MMPIAAEWYAVLPLSCSPASVERGFGQLTELEPQLRVLTQKHEMDFLQVLNWQVCVGQ